MSVIPLRPGQTGARARVPAGMRQGEAGGVPSGPVDGPANGLAGGAVGTTAGSAGTMSGAASGDGAGARVRLTPEAQTYLARKGGHVVLQLQPVRGCG